VTPASYTAAARRIAEIAKHVEDNADAQTPHQKKARTRAINTLVRYARLLYEKNAGLSGTAAHPSLGRTQADKS
jgi:hypothetical protein